MLGDRAQAIFNQAPIPVPENVTTAKITIDGYLVQAKLEKAVREIVGAEAWQGREIRLPIGRRRWDMGYSRFSQITVIEFDGDEHYRNTLKIKADEEKDRIAIEHSFRVVRIPYWVQLTTETVHHYLGLDAEIQQDFPHGFITTKIFPASYCPLGLARFKRELKTLPDTVRRVVLGSLRDRCAEHGRLYVIPPELDDIV